MGFVNPAYLFALAGMLVPLAIHLWSKKEGRIIKVGSTQFLPEIESKKSSSIRINEIWLLILRMLMLAVLAFILTQPFFITKTDYDQKASFIDPEVSAEPRVRKAIDSLINQDYTIYWFAPGFPEYGTASPSGSVSYWHLLKDMEDFEAVDLVVISSARQANIIGERPAIDRSVAWLTVDETEPTKFIVSAVPVDDRTLITSGKSTPISTTFSSFYESAEASLEKDTGITQVLTDTLLVRIDADPKFKSEERYVKAAFNAIKDLTKWPIKLTNRLDAQWLVGLTDSVVSLGDSKHQLIYRADSLAEQLVMKGDSASVFWLTQRLNEENVMDQNLVLQLFEIIRPTVIGTEKLLSTYDVRMASDQQLQPNYASAGGFEDVMKTSITTYLWLFFLILFATERTISMLRKQ